MADKLDAMIGFHQTALRVRAQRQELIAANIANADTPNYKAKDVDFGAALARAMNGTQPATALTQTNGGHLAAAPATLTALGTPGGVQFRPEVQGSVDGNTVDMDVERNQFIDNAVRYETSLTVLNGQLKRLMSAINGQ